MFSLHRVLHGSSLCCSCIPRLSFFRTCTCCSLLSITGFLFGSKSFQILVSHWIPSKASTPLTPVIAICLQLSFPVDVSKWRGMSLWMMTLNVEISNPRTLLSQLVIESAFLPKSLLGPPWAPCYHFSPSDVVSLTLDVNSSECSPVLRLASLGFFPRTWASVFLSACGS